MNNSLKSFIFIFLVATGLSVFLVSCGGSTASADNPTIETTKTASDTKQPVNQNTTEELQTEENKEAVATVTTSENPTEKTVTIKEKTAIKKESNSNAKKEKKDAATPKEKKTVKEVINNTVDKVGNTIETAVDNLPKIIKKKVDEKVEETTPEKKVDSPTPKDPPAASTSKKQDLSHDKWNELTGKFISSAGKVDYAGIKSNKGMLTQYLQVLESNPPQSSWPRNKIIAYWINAYNAHTIKLIVDNYPVSSIKDLDGGNPWEIKRIKIGEKTYSLNQIEKEILIKQYKEPRVHFAVNCAAKSCPPIINKAWTAENLESNLENSTSKFLNNPTYNDISNPKSIKISKIFDWYAADFGDVITFINKYAETPINSGAKISYNDYNWSLNN